MFLTAISMSLGWRIRGQFGHEIGAAMAGALAGLAIVLAGGREHWRRRAPICACLCAIGWSFGGSMSYMKVVGFCHSSDSATALYGFTGLSLLGFVWAAPGGAATAMALMFDADRLSRLFAAIAAAVCAWFVQDVVVDILVSRGVEVGWYGSDWLAASAAILGVGSLAAVRRRLDDGVSLVLHLAIGWWIAFGGLVLIGGLHFNPPRGDNWAGCIGIVGGLLVYCWRQNLTEVLRGTLVTGFAGAAGFALGQLFKLSLIAGDLTANPHVMMEWTHGAVLGLALAIGMLPLLNRTSPAGAEPAAQWTQIFSVMFVFWFLTYYNFAKCALQWVKASGGPTKIWQGLSLAAQFRPSRGWIGWIDIVFLALGVVLLLLLLRRRRVSSPLLPENAHGRAQLLYLLLVWAYAFSSFARDVTNFGTDNEMRIQVFITLHAVLCTLLALWPAVRQFEPRQSAAPRRSIGAILAAGVLLCAATIGVCFSGKQMMFGEEFAPGFYMDHIRFGPNNTNDQK